MKKVLTLLLKLFLLTIDITYYIIFNVLQTC